MRCDYLIISAGLAGATCAYLLQACGASVVLVERADAVCKNKLCGGLLTPRALRLADELFGDEVEVLYRESFASMRCIASSHVIELDDIAMRSLDRRELDNVPLNRFLGLGGELVDRAKSCSFDFDARRAVAHIPEGELAIDYITLIAADEASSCVRQAMEGVSAASEMRGKRPLLSATLEADVVPSGQPLTMMYDPQLCGYCWYVPCGDGGNIGCGTNNGSKNLRERLDYFANLMGVEYSNLRGALLPRGANVTLKRDEAYFLGDAAGLICPPSGEGVFYAMESAVQLAESLLDPGSLSYERRMAKYVRLIARQYAMRDLLFNEKLLRAAHRISNRMGMSESSLASKALLHFCGFSGR